jgi:hypothetical protein
MPDDLRRAVVVAAYIGNDVRNLVEVGRTRLQDDFGGLDLLRMAPSGWLIS